MITINEEFLKLQNSYLFVAINEKVKEIRRKCGKKNLIDE